MRRGFTLIELMAASLLLAMLVTVLTMIFNQSSIAWRTGVASVSDLDLVRDNIAEVREEADNAYIWNNEVHRIIGLWDDETGDLRTRAWDVDTESKSINQAQLLKSRGGSLRDNSTLKNFSVIAVGNGDSSGSIKTYLINVKSNGPDREPDTWDDIWSFPDEIN